MKLSFSVSKLCWAAVLFGALSAGTLTAVAQDEKVVDLTGIWTVTAGNVVFYDGRITDLVEDYDEFSVEIVRQEGRVFFTRTLIVPKTQRITRGGMVMTRLRLILLTQWAP